MAIEAQIRSFKSLWIHPNLPTPARRFGRHSALTPLTFACLFVSAFAHISIGENSLVHVCVVYLKFFFFFTIHTYIYVAYFFHFRFQFFFVLHFKLKTFCRIACVHFCWLLTCLFSMRPYIGHMNAWMLEFVFCLFCQYMYICVYMGACLQFYVL